MTGLYVPARSPAAREEGARAERFPLPPLGFAISVLLPTFFSHREAWKDTCPCLWGCNRLQIGAVSCSSLLPPWHGVMVPVAFPTPCGFSGSEAPWRAETRSSCLSDPQVKDEDKALAVKRPGKEDGAVSVAGHGQGGAVSGMGLSPWWGQTPCQGLGTSQRVVGSAFPPVPGERRWPLQGSVWRVVGVFGRDAQLLMRSDLSLGLVPALHALVGRQVGAHPVVTVPAPALPTKAVGRGNLVAHPVRCREAAGALSTEFYPGTGSMRVSGSLGAGLGTSPSLPALGTGGEL